MAPERTIVKTEQAPDTIGPYSQAVIVMVGGQKIIYTSGQVAIDPVTGDMIEGDVAAQTRRVLDNLAAVLTAAGASFERVVKTTIFLADMNDFSIVNGVYGERFPKDPPARSTVQVARLPLDARVEIEVVAVI
jgi:2-iminobutanoate/2-iminopropanoate deaminase